MFNNKSGLLQKSFGNFLLIKNSWAAWIVLFASLAITLSLFLISKNDSYEKAKVRFDFTAGEIKVAIDRRMADYEQILKGSVGLFNVKSDITRSEFKTYFDELELDKNYPGIQGLGFAKVVYPNELKTHIQQVRKEGFPNYNVFPEYQRDIYIPIIYIEPFSGRNLRAFGYDMFTNPIRQEAMKKAMLHNKAVATGPVILVQETNVDVQKGFLVYTPVYRKNADISTEEKRRKALTGFVYNPFRINDLMSGIMGGQPENIILKIFDGNAPVDSNLIYATRNHREMSEPLFVLYTSQVHNERNWILGFYSTNNFEELLDDQKSYIVLISGIVISLLLFFSGIIFSRNRVVSKTLEEILEATGEGIYGLDNEGKCMFINRAALDMIGFEKDVCTNNIMHDLIHYKKESGEPYPINECPLQLSLRTAQKISADDEVFWRKDGSGFHVEFSANPIFEKGVLKGTVVAFRDITERKKYEEETKNSLKEKEILLKEIHHRVKNNMQVISSLLNLQSQYVQDKDEYIRLAFQDSQNRIRSMALIHEKLYQSEDFSHINFGDYAKELLDKLVETYRQQSGNTALEINSNGIILNMDTSISLGLILNEIVTNSFKHGFTERKSENKITIDLFKGNDSFVLTISDNGKGFPQGVDFRNTESLGLQLVNTLIYQINGDINLISGEGTKFVITFPFEN